MKNDPLYEKTLSLSGRLSVMLDDWTIELRIVSNDGGRHLETLKALHGKTIQVILKPPMPQEEVIDGQCDFSKRDQ